MVLVFDNLLLDIGTLPHGDRARRRCGGGSHAGGGEGISSERCAAVRSHAKTTPWPSRGRERPPGRREGASRLKTLPWVAGQCRECAGETVGDNVKEVGGRGKGEGCSRVAVEGVYHGERGHQSLGGRKVLALGGPCPAKRCRKTHHSNMPGVFPRHGWIAVGAGFLSFGSPE